MIDPFLSTMISMLTRVPVVMLLFSTLLFACDGRPAPYVSNIPEGTRDSVALELGPGYGLIAHINPFYLRADLDGDGRIDYAFLVEHESSCKVGIAIFLSRRPGRSLQVLGAGRPFAFASGSHDDFSFVDAWQVHEKGPVNQGATEAAPPRLLGDAILVEKTGSASGLIYWNGKHFRWYQQGD